MSAEFVQADLLCVSLSCDGIGEGPIEETFGQGCVSGDVCISQSISQGWRIKTEK